MNDICLIYVSCAQELQLSHLVFIYEKETGFVPKSGKIVIKVNGVISSYKIDTPAAKSNMSQKKKKIRTEERYLLNLFFRMLLTE